MIQQLLGTPPSTYSDDPGITDLPIAGTTGKQAKDYCSWVGGSLPSFSQWQLATRGESVTKFPWGNDDLTCDNFFFVPTTIHAQPQGTGDASPMPHGCCGGDCTQAKVGQHPRGASPSGVEDVMLTPKCEFIGTDSSRLGIFSCSRADACVVSSRSPGVPSSATLVGAPADQTYGIGFRCAWER